MVVDHFEEKWCDEADLFCGHDDLPLFAPLTFDSDLKSRRFSGREHLRPHTYFSKGKLNR
jgi:hypothetical protein